MISGLKQVKNKEHNRGFTITEYYGGNELETHRSFLSLDHLHTCAANEHIGEIERSIQKIKKRVR